MLLSFVCVKIQWIVCCRWIKAPADACFVQSVKHDKLNIGALVRKRTSNSYNISSFWICSIKVDKCLRTYYKLSWKYVNKVEIISKATITLSLIKSNKDFDFVGWVIKTPCLYCFHGVKVHYVKETRDINSLFTLVKVILVSQHKKQPNKSFSRFDTDSDLKVRALHYAKDLLVWHRTCLSKTFANSPNKQKQ